jgi:hypothetical protein
VLAHRLLSLGDLLKDADELVGIFTASRKTAKGPGRE